MADFQVGEVVDITIKGVRFLAPAEDEGGSVVIRAADGTEGWIMPPQAEIARVAPAEWPPQPGDLWRDRDGDTWHGVLVDDNDTVDEPYTVLGAGRSSKNNAVEEPGQILEWHGPLALVHREQQDGGEAR
ncbi:hypothetical protein [Actinocorallia longicatena]|uniref:Uncharacterized protein n=1 Tax=Actinocorallia longicatena TaxID=111803 RepID=A0ABP6QDV7_9ACTN